MIRKTLAATTLALTALAALPAAADIITKMSPHSVPDTIDRLEAAVTEAGATVFARVDHAEGATKVDMELRPTTLLIFGNPKLGTPARSRHVHITVSAQARNVIWNLVAFCFNFGDGRAVVMVHHRSRGHQNGIQF